MVEQYSIQGFAGSEWVSPRLALHGTLSCLYDIKALHFYGDEVSQLTGFHSSRAAGCSGVDLHNAEPV